MHKLKILWVAVVVIIMHCGSEQKPCFLWIDASANFERMNNKDTVTAILDKIVAAGIDGIVVDLKPISGEVLYTSQYAPRLYEWKGARRDSSFNYAEFILAQGHQRDLNVYAAINVFSEGWKTRQRGVIYSTHPQWQTYLYTPEQGIVATSEYEQGYAAFANPILPAVQAYELNIIREIMEKFNFDGIILDRARYDNIKSDFSDYSRRQFEIFMDHEIEHWPEDIFTWTKDSSGAWQVQPGKYYPYWLYWRAEEIHDFFVKARSVVKEVSPQKQFATYVGAWYPSYYRLGVNWAHPNYDPQYSWVVENYAQTGYADLLDFLMTGCYYYHVTVDEVEAINRHRQANQEAGMEDIIKRYHTVEGSAEMALDVTLGQLPVYGSLYVQQYKDRHDPQQFIAAIQMVLDKTDGIMIFDLCHLEDFGWWPHLIEGFKQD